MKENNIINIPLKLQHYVVLQVESSEKGEKKEKKKKHVKQ